MNSNTNNQTRAEQVRSILQSWLGYLKQPFSYALSVAILVGASFVLMGNPSAKAYSDRLFTVGILITMLGVFVFVTIAGTRRNLGIPTLARKPEEARKVMDNVQVLIGKAEKRYDAGAQVWIVGILCMVISIFAYFLLTILKY
jgi:hypothetical protein